MFLLITVKNTSTNPNQSFRNTPMMKQSFLSHLLLRKIRTKTEIRVMEILIMVMPAVKAMEAMTPAAVIPAVVIPAMVILAAAMSVAVIPTAAILAAVMPAVVRL